MDFKELKWELLFDAIRHQAMRRGLPTEWSHVDEGFPPAWRFNSVVIMIDKNKRETFVLVNLRGDEGLKTGNLFEVLEYIADKEPWIAIYLADPKNTAHFGSRP